MLKDEGTLVLRGGRVIDPVSGTNGIAAVMIVDGTIAAVGPGAGGEARSTAAGAGQLVDEPGAEVVDCTGLIVTPGLTDLHAHVFPGLGDFCVEPDRAAAGCG